MRIVITGGHSGIGLELTRRLLADGHEVGLVVRSASRAEQTRELFGSSANIELFVADLSDRAAVAALAAEIANAWPRVDGLFNNAGVLLGEATYAGSGNEMHYQVNTLAPYVLTLGLKAALAASPSPFVVNTVTGGMHGISALDVADLKRPASFRRLTGPYRQSKFALTTLMTDLARQWPEVRIVNVDPGPNKTPMTAGEGMPALLRPIRRFVFSDPEAGAGKLHDAAFGSIPSGSYLASLPGPFGGSRQVTVLDPSSLDELSEGLRSTVA